MRHSWGVRHAGGVRHSDTGWHPRARYSVLHHVRRHVVGWKIGVDVARAQVLRHVARMVGWKPRVTRSHVAHVCRVSRAHVARMTHVCLAHGRMTGWQMSLWHVSRSNIARNVRSQVAGMVGVVGR